MGNTKSELASRLFPAVHPHLRGEYDLPKRSRALFVGSPPPAWGIHDCRAGASPLLRFTPTCVGNTRQCFRNTANCTGSPPPAWGILGFASGGRGLLRFTPTCVGNTHQRQRRRSHRAVHPHLRGEYRRRYRGRRYRHGSPPPAWGIRGDLLTLLPLPRFTPTCVGNTQPSLWNQCDRPVHPHLRGEYRVVEVHLYVGVGSPPPAWGILPLSVPRLRATRFTPTCVGNTRELVRQLSAETVHPHLRGEYVGSAARVGDENRFTPTCVGNTVVGHERVATRTVHPHLRGEYAALWLDKLHSDGSPPPAWGIPATRSARKRLRRFTPTCVGNTCRFVAGPVVPPVHPHLRGEYVVSPWRTRDWVGSPPPAWGILTEPQREEALSRFTPTCVGNTPISSTGRRGVSVHPHLRGEYFCGSLHAVILPGSPPPAWGILLYLKGRSN